MDYKKNEEGTEQEKKWGGARKGAGRKDGLKKQTRKRVLSLFLTDAQWSALEREADANNSKLSSIVTKQIESFSNDLILKHGINEPINQENTNINGE